MKKVLDLHIHSKYSRACSKRLEPLNIAEFCRLKGVDIVATGDFTHPEWLKMLAASLGEEGKTGLYYCQAAPDNPVRFLFSTEVSLIYKDGGRARRIHLVVHAPNLEAASALQKVLAKRFNVVSDGRPILGISAPEFVKICLSIHPLFLVYPAHIWTPWFSVFGSKSGFDSLEECFKEQTQNIFAIETGLSSDPEMNWRLSALDKLTILSNSDAHSPENIGREANVFEFLENRKGEVGVSYQAIYDIIKEGRKFIPGENDSGLASTLEFYPEEGMYHIDGHRVCNFSCYPEKSRLLKNTCPHCGRPLILGVLHRVEELADRPTGFRPTNAVPFQRLVELDKIIAEVLNLKNRQSRKVQAVYQQMIYRFGGELDILLKQDLKIVAEEFGGRLAEAIKRVREGRLVINPGFDGVYGELKIFSQEEQIVQRKLF